MTALDYVKSKFAYDLREQDASASFDAVSSEIDLLMTQE
jgi:hypothetical protein